MSYAVLEHIPGLDETGSPKAKILPGLGLLLDANTNIKGCFSVITRLGIEVLGLYIQLPLTALDLRLSFKAKS